MLDVTSSFLLALLEEKGLMPYVYEKRLTAKETLMHQGEVAHQLYLVTKGALRLWHNDDGRDITVQFFFDNEMILSLESFLEQKESLYSLQAIEETEVYYLEEKGLEQLLSDEAFLPIFNQILSQKLIRYNHLFLSRIKDSPEKRYKKLVEERSDLVWRIPDVYLASYLGVTPVSLSRIRKRLS